MLKYYMFSYKSLLVPLFLSFFIYSAYFGFDSKLVNTIFALFGISSLFILSKKELLLVGFLTALLWFWWIAKSFVFYDLSYLIPLVLFGIGLVYGILFYFIGFFNSLIYKLVYIFMLSFINPFSFNWFKLELPFINSYFGTSKIEFFIILCSIAWFLHIYKTNQIKSILFLSSSLIGLYFYNYSNAVTIEKPSLKILEYNTKINQADKWKKFYRTSVVEENLRVIENAIKENYDLVIFPETAFPLLLNSNKEIDKKLLELSYNISIVTGALYKKDGLYYNSTYFYENGKRELAHKVVLVPFGEAVPLPEKIRDIINNLFYNGAKDYDTAKKPTTFTIKGEKFRNAICYEITTDAIYDELDTKYIIGISNNAWFSPSVQPTLQKLLMKYYAKKYNVYHIEVSNSL